MTANYLLRKRLCFLWLLLLLQSYISLAQDKITLEQAIEMATKNNLQVKKSINDERNSELNLFKSKQNLLPTLTSDNTGSLYIGHGLDPTTNLYLNKNSIASTINLTSSFTVFQGFQKLNQIKANSLQLYASENALQKAKNDITIQIIATYLAVLDYNSQLLTAEEQYKLSMLQLDFEKKSFDLGKKMLADVSRATYQVTKTKLDITNVKNQLENEKLDLAQLMNYPPGKNFDLVEPTQDESLILTDSISLIYKHAEKFLPEIKLAEYNKLTALKSVEIAKGSYYPTLTFNSGLFSSYSYQFHYVPSLFSFQTSQLLFFRQLRSNGYGYFGLNLNIPIFNNGISKISVKKAKIDLENAILDEELAKNNLFKVINQAVSDVHAATENYVSAKSALESANETFKAIKGRYESKLSNSLDFTQAQNDLYQAQFLVIRAKYDLIFKEKVLNFYNGEVIVY